MIIVTITDTVEEEILHKISIEIPEDRTEEDLGNEIQEVIGDFFEIEEE